MAHVSIRQIRLITRQACMSPVRRRVWPVYNIYLMLEQTQMSKQRKVEHHFI